MGIRFTKMHGCGNDFVVINTLDQAFEPTPERIRAIAERRFGVGCDQVLLVAPAQGGEARFRYRIFNADGGEVEQCGNGARCFARFVRDKGLFADSTIPVETAAGLLTLELTVDGRVRVEMGVPTLLAQAVPFEADDEGILHRLRVGDQETEIAVVGLGNPHAVLLVEDLEHAPVRTLGSAIESHPRFPRRTNVGFVQMIDRGRIRLRVWERGAGETLACGSGACAAVVVGRALDLLDEQVRVALRGGEVEVRWPGRGQPVWLTGPAETVFEGELAS